VELGDKIMARISYGMEGGALLPREEGTVVYIHPEGRFYTLEFTFPGGLDGKPRKFRESYWTMPEGAAAEDPGLGGRPPGHYRQNGALGKYLESI
jgi:hypothetical protein